MDFGEGGQMQSSLKSTFGSEKRNLILSENVRSTSFLVNRIELLIGIVVLICLSIIAGFFLKFEPLGQHFIVKLIYKFTKLFFFFGIYLAILMEGFFFGCLLVCYEYYEAIKHDNYNFLSMMFTTVVMLILIALPIALIVHYSIYGKKKKVIQHGYFAQFYVGIDTEKRFVNGYYMAFQLLRRGFMGACCALLVDKDFDVRVGVFAYGNLIGLVPLILLRPYHDWKMNVIEIINEVQFIIVSLLILSSQGDAYERREPTIYWVSLLAGILV